MKTLAKKDWEAVIVLTETEGDESSTRPWYNKADIVQLIRHALNQSGPMRDLTVQAINAHTDDREYYR